MINYWEKHWNIDEKNMISDERKKLNEWDKNFAKLQLMKKNNMEMRLVFAANYLECTQFKEFMCKCIAYYINEKRVEGSKEVAQLQEEHKWVCLCIN